ncbi:ALOX5 [Mytilus coruscus]|uniref:ALOX5 n=1 Tax=Mytilus coruscus TaxID=42192 RepID=A0A6J8A2N4_MYTCO|nr:ALOX5 [Mytilus coruscus]
MVFYKIAVKTSDHIRDGTDANVYIKLYEEGNQTIVHALDNCFKNDFERDHIDIFSVSSQFNISKVQRVELWRDNCGFLSNWYLDWIEVTNKATNTKCLFPAMKWIKENHRYFFNNMDSCLPQDDPFKESRKSKLQDKQKEYELRVNIDGLPAQVKELPEEEKFSCIYKCRLEIETMLNEAAKFCLVKCNGNEWKDFDDVKNMYTLFGCPRGSKYFNDDESFGRQRLNGLNPSLLKLCTGIPEKFGVTEDIIRPFLEGKTMRQAMDGNRLFIIDLGILEDCPTLRKYIVMTCPFALFYFNDCKRLMPIAIQLFQKENQSFPVFLPSDPEYTWMLAKMWYSLADSTYHQALTHLNFTHLMMEGISVAAKRNLAHSHPIMNLLNPHFLYLMAIDSLALSTLIEFGGIIDKTSNAGINGHFYLMRKSMDWWSLDLHGTLPEELKSRGSPVTEDCILQTIANRPQLLELMAITKVLSQKATQSLGDFERQMIVDPPAVEIVKEFQQKLRDVGKIIDKRNKQREHPYDWLHPKAIPNAISI